MAIGISRWNVIWGMRVMALKKQYKVLIIILIVEFVLLSILQEQGFQVKSLIGNFVGLFICILPLQILLFIKGREEHLSKIKKFICKLFFWQINICYLLCLIVALIGSTGNS